MKTLILVTLVLFPLTGFAQTMMTIECKNPDQGVTQFVLRNDSLHQLSKKDVRQITHSKVKAEYWEVTSKAANSLTLVYVLEDSPTAMYLDGKYQVTLTQKPENGAYTAGFYRRYDDQTLTYSCLERR